MRSRGWIPVVLLGAAAAIATMATPDAGQLVRKLASERAADRDAAAAALRDLGPRARPALEEAARGGPASVRRRARALLDLERQGTAPGSPAAARAAREVVRGILRDPRGLRAGSEPDQALRALGADGARALARGSRRAVARALLPADLAVGLARHAHPETIALLVELVEERRMSPSTTLLAARALERHDAEYEDRLLPRLLLAARARSGPARRGAVALLAAVGEDATVPALIRFCDDSYPGVRGEAARALGRIAPAEGAPHLRRLADDADDDVRRAALDALARVPGPPEPDPALRNADHGNPLVRAAAARLLGRDATPRALPALMRLSRDESIRVRQAARRSQERLGLGR